MYEKKKETNVILSVKIPQNSTTNVDYKKWKNTKNFLAFISFVSHFWSTITLISFA